MLTEGLVLKRQEKLYHDHLKPKFSLCRPFVKKQAWRPPFFIGVIYS